MGILENVHQLGISHHALERRMPFGLDVQDVKKLTDGGAWRWVVPRDEACKFVGATYAPLNEYDRP